MEQIVFKIDEEQESCSSPSQVKDESSEPEHEENNSESKKKPGEDTSQPFFLFFPFGSKNKKVVSEEMLLLVDDTVNCNDDSQDETGDIDIDTSGSQRSEEITFETQSEINRNSIFREPAALVGDSADGALDINPSFHNNTRQQLLMTAASEDGILDGNNKCNKHSKANFPFLSALKLLPSYKKSIATEESSAESHPMVETVGSSTSEDCLIRRIMTWGAPETDSQGGGAQKDQRKNPGSEATTSPARGTVPSEPSRDKECVSERDESDFNKIDEDEEEEDKTSNSLEWTTNGPPPHWATQQSLKSMIPKSKANKDDPTEPNNDANGDGPLHFTSHPFASVSRALQENIIAHFRPVVDRYRYPSKEKEGTGSKEKEGTGSKDKEDTGTSSDIEEVDPKTSESILSQSAGEASESDPRSSQSQSQEQPISKTQSVDSESPSEADVEGLLEEAKPKVDTLTSNKRLGIATVAGGIAGGVAGLIIAGPVGLVIGTKAGQTAGILALILDGSVTIGVFASGVAAGKYTGQQLQEKLEQNRVLSFGEDGTQRRVLLVRPSVTTDPVWADIYREARQSHSKGRSFSRMLPNESKAVKRERYERDVDIVKTDEDEIPTADKVLLLVSRLLNNRESLPGHVYRHLLERLRHRSEARGPLRELFLSPSNSIEEEDEEVVDPDHPTLDKSRDLRRARRQDAHAVIKYVTATLLEVRPGFAVSPSITELTATAVEGLVFGEVYDLVIDEIEAEYDFQDNELLEKIAAFDRRQVEAASTTEDGVKQYTSCVSEPALDALHRLPEAHSAVDKLRYCVLFLERISDYFSASCSSSAMGADSLLKMVCQHILVAKVFAVNAQVAFLEEFARDEQLLRGKEGYALVTLQASLHFLNASEDFENDIFGQQDDY